MGISICLNQEDDHTGFVNVSYSTWREWKEKIADLLLSKEAGIQGSFWEHAYQVNPQIIEVEVENVCKAMMTHEEEKLSFSELIGFLAINHIEGLETPVPLCRVQACKTWMNKIQYLVTSCDENAKIPFELERVSHKFYEDALQKVPSLKPFLTLYFKGADSTPLSWQNCRDLEQLFSKYEIDNITSHLHSEILSNFLRALREGERQKIGLAFW